MRIWWRLRRKPVPVLMLNAPFDIVGVDGKLTRFTVTRMDWNGRGETHVELQDVASLTRDRTLLR